MNTQAYLVNILPNLAHNQVQAAKHLISDSGLVIPRGSLGRIIEYTRAGGLIIDFGALPVFCVPAGSPLVEMGRITK